MDDKTIGQKINDLRAKQGLTTTELGKRIGISQAQISRLENGRQGFRVTTLRKIAEALNVDLSHFFEEESDSRVITRVLGKVYQEMTTAEGGLIINGVIFDFDENGNFTGLSVPVATA
jgi:transcriptional regulator with XRE-family HTH domain